MTLQEKIDRYMAETREQNVGAWTAAPPITRVLWKLHLDVAPPFYWSFASGALGNGVFFAVCMFCWNVFLFGEPWHRQIVGVLIGGAFFGLMMAAFSRRRARMLRLSPWHGDVAGDV
jgi:hypothetical protein